MLQFIITIPNGVTRRCPSSSEPSAITRYVECAECVPRNVGDH